MQPCVTGATVEFCWASPDQDSSKSARHTKKGFQEEVISHVFLKINEIYTNKMESNFLPSRNRCRENPQNHECETL